MTMLLAATIVFVGSHTSDAQDQTPSPQMLLNLDLFAPSKDNRANQASADSMLQQLRALRSMGYLSDTGPLPDVDYDPDTPSDAPAPTFPRTPGRQQ